jgi:hypothetical protein
VNTAGYFYFPYFVSYRLREWIGCSAFKSLISGLFFYLHYAVNPLGMIMLFIIGIFVPYVQEDNHGRSYPYRQTQQMDTGKQRRTPQLPKDYF